MGMERRGWRA